MGRSRGGLTTKIHALVDAEGRPIRIALTPGQAHDGTAADTLLNDLKPGAILLADKAYDSNAIRQQAQEQDVWANIPPKSNRKGSFVFSAFLYRYRNLVERIFNNSTS
jgi:transposase